MGEWKDEEADVNDTKVIGMSSDPQPKRGAITVGGRMFLRMRVVRTGVSPMNPKVKWAQLECGHDAFSTRKPRIGALVVCEKCYREEI